MTYLLVLIFIEISLSNAQFTLPAMQPTLDTFLTPNNSFPNNLTSNNGLVQKVGNYIYILSQSTSSTSTYMWNSTSIFSDPASYNLVQHESYILDWND